MQAIQLLAGNLGNVLFSGLGQFAGDPARQGRAALSAGRVLALVGMPLCFLQAAAAEPAMRVLFMSKADPAKWEPAVPLVQMLSVGMGFNCIGWAGISLGQALGRFRSLLGLFIVAAAVFFGAAWGGAVIGGRVGWRVEVGVAAGVAAYFVVMSCVGFAVILRWAGIGLGQLAAIYPVPMVGGGGAALAGWWVAQQTHGEGRPAEVVRGAVTGLVFFAIYGPIAWFGAPGARRQVTGRVRELLPRRFRQRVRGVPA
jgi:O-antigen/teichoic acid export membrane protein